MSEPSAPRWQSAARLIRRQRLFLDMDGVDVCVLSVGRSGPPTVRPVWAAWTAVGGLTLTAACSLIARTGRVSGWERALFRAANGLPGWLNRPMWLMQLAGVIATPLLVAAGAALRRRWRLAAALVLLAPLKLLVELHVLKRLIERGRPGENEPGAILRGVPPAGLSFPSGHAIVAFGIAVLLAPYLRGRWRALLFGLAALVCVARVYLGAHNPLDVVAGAGAGLLLGGLLTLLLGVRGRPGRARSAPTESGEPPRHPTVGGIP